MMSIAHPSRRARIGNSAASIATCSYPALPLGTGASDPTASIAISGRLRRPVPARDEGKQSGGIDCNGNKHSGRVSEDIPGTASVVFGARYGALGVIWPFCCIGPVQKSQKYAL